MTEWHHSRRVTEVTGNRSVRWALRRVARGPGISTDVRFTREEGARWMMMPPPRKSMMHAPSMLHPSESLVCLLGVGDPTCVVDPIAAHQARKPMCALRNVLAAYQESGPWWRLRPWRKPNQVVAIPWVARIVCLQLTTRSIYSRTCLPLHVRNFVAHGNAVLDYLALQHLPCANLT